MATVIEKGSGFDPEAKNARIPNVLHTTELTPQHWVTIAQRTGGKPHLTPPEATSAENSDGFSPHIVYPYGRLEITPNPESGPDFRIAMHDGDTVSLNGAVAIEPNNVVTFITRLPSADESDPSQIKIVTMQRGEINVDRKAGFPPEQYMATDVSLEVGLAVRLLIGKPATSAGD